MTLPAPAVELLQDVDSLAERREHHPWGAVTGDSRYPQVHEANRALVFLPHPVTAAEVLDALRRMRDSVGAAFEQAEILDLAGRGDLRDAMQREIGPPQRFLFMQWVQRPLPEAVAPGVSISAVEPDWQMWRFLKQAANPAIPEPALDQIARRLTTVMAEPRRRFFLAQRDGAVAGGASVHLSATACLIDDVVTVAEHRRSGIASMVIAHALGAAADRGRRNVFLFTAEGGPARRLYERLGFTTIAVSEQFHRDLPG